MIAVRQAESRGTANFGWLDSRHTFSFGNYYDPDFMGFGPLRVINEDRVKPGAGFDTHGHRDMEILSYVLDGALEHKDSLGTGAVLRPGDVQIMSAGTGIRHSEFNHSKSDPVHFLQIWLLPDQDGITPRYVDKTFTDADKQGRLLLLASSDGRDGSVLIHQDSSIYATRLNGGDQVSHTLAKGRKAWVQVARGSIEVNGKHLRAGDGAAIVEDETIALTGKAAATEVLLFDLP
jgi:redox-sensitive bicupin YhaK (pirin superfamily)